MNQLEYLPAGRYSKLRLILSRYLLDLIIKIRLDSTKEITSQPQTNIWLYTVNHLPYLLCPLPEGLNYDLYNICIINYYF
jgi:hypothetical protein